MKQKAEEFTLATMPKPQTTEDVYRSTLPKLVVIALATKQVAREKQLRKHERSTIQLR
jgi:hypothetical protein